MSPFAKPSFVGTRHYSTASIVKTEELLLGLPPNNYGDLFATDLRDMFQSTYNGITAPSIPFNREARYQSTPEGRASGRLSISWMSRRDRTATAADSARSTG